MHPTRQSPEGAVLVGFFCFFFLSFVETSCHCLAPDHGHGRGGGPARGGDMGVVGGLAEKASAHSGTAHKSCREASVFGEEC